MSHPDFEFTSQPATVENARAADRHAPFDEAAVRILERYGAVRHLEAVGEVAQNKAVRRLARATAYRLRQRGVGREADPLAREVVDLRVQPQVVPPQVVLRREARAAEEQRLRGSVLGGDECPYCHKKATRERPLSRHVHAGAAGMWHMKCWHRFERETAETAADMTKQPVIGPMTRSERRALERKHAAWSKTELPDFRQALVRAHAEKTKDLPREDVGDRVDTDLEARMRAAYEAQVGPAPEGPDVETAQQLQSLQDRIYGRPGSAPIEGAEKFIEHRRVERAHEAVTRTDVLAYASSTDAVSAAAVRASPGIEVTPDNAHEFLGSGIWPDALLQSLIDERNDPPPADGTVRVLTKYSVWREENGKKVHMGTYRSARTYADEGDGKTTLAGGERIDWEKGSGKR